MKKVREFELITIDVHGNKKVEKVQMVTQATSWEKREARIKRNARLRAGAIEPEIPELVLKGSLGATFLDDFESWKKDRR